MSYQCDILLAKQVKKKKNFRKLFIVSFSLLFFFVFSYFIFLDSFCEHGRFFNQKKTFS